MNTLPPGAEPRDPTLDRALTDAWRAKGKGYRPRTHHLQPDGSPTYVNRLILETSPYLLQHAHNPVDWRPWGSAAFEEARRLDKPVFLSVGYATCHWCHVMERESFEDEAVAALLNEGYIPIKVDREERPDIDSIYMSCLGALTGQGGWPMNVWLNHDTQPFFAGTYFPPEDRHGRVGFRRLLDRISELWRSDRQALDRQAEELVRALQDELSMDGAVGTGLPGPEILHAAAAHFRRTFDSSWGGFGDAPKFPRSEALRFLLRYQRRTGDGVALEMVRKTLFAMQEGGIHDHLGGGFARYSVDRKWLVPHFEKMLYDNALLVLAYLEGYLATGEEAFALTAKEVLDYVEREMIAPEGAFFSATDADSEGEEGRFFAWTPDEIDQVLGLELGRTARAWYGVTPGGDFEGGNVLHTFRSVEEVADELGMEAGELRSSIEESRRLLHQARAKRIHPELDDKVIASWNGLMIGAFATASRVLGLPRLAETAARAAAFVLEEMRDDEGRLCRTWREGRARHTGMLDDYAFIVSSLLDLFEATGEIRWFEEAKTLQEDIDRRFADPSGGWFSTPDDHESLLIRPKEIYEGAIPTGGSVSALNCLRLHALTDDGRHRDAAEGALRAARNALLRAPTIAPTLLSALDWSLDRPAAILLTRPVSADEGVMAAALRGVFAPNAVRLSLSEDRMARAEEHIPLTRDRRPLGAEETAYICLEGSCRLPTTNPEEAAAILAEVHPLP